MVIKQEGEKVRTSKEVREELEDIKKSQQFITDGTDQIITGWIEALEWVLSDYVEEGK